MNVAVLEKLDKTLRLRRKAAVARVPPSEKYLRGYLDALDFVSDDLRRLDALEWQAILRRFKERVAE